MIENLNLWEIINEDMYYFLLLFQAPQEDCYEQNHHQANPKVEKKDIDEMMMAEVVRLRLGQKWIINSLREKLKLSQFQITNIFKTD